MITKELKNGMVELVAAPGKWLHKPGTETYIRRAPVKADRIGDWEEVDTKPAYTEAEYEAKVEELIRERYSPSQEFALINNVLAGVTQKRQQEYDAYQAYRAQCKARAKELLTAHADEEAPSLTED